MRLAADVAHFNPLSCVASGDDAGLAECRVLVLALLPRMRQVLRDKCGVSGLCTPEQVFDFGALRGE